MKNFKEWLEELENSENAIGSFPIHIKNSIVVSKNSRPAAATAKINLNNSPSTILIGLLKPISKII